VRCQNKYSYILFLYTNVNTESDLEKAKMGFLSLNVWKKEH